MSELAIRKSDNTEIKIGTCETMYYLRFEDKNKVTPDKNSGFGWFWRIPFPDEDHILPGDYKNHQRGYRLYQSRKHGCDDFVDESTVNEPGIIQLHHESGLLLNVLCYHGHKLPETTGDMKAFWNGKSWNFELVHIREDNGNLFPVVWCRHCHKMWRYDWSDVMPYVQDKTLAERLCRYEQYGK